MRILLRPLQWIYSIYAFLMFVLFMIPVYLFSVGASFLGNIKGGNLIYRACMLWGDIWFPLVGIWHKNIFEQPVSPHKSYIFVANHISFLDAAIIVMTFRKPLRPLAKAELSKVPLFGFIYKKAVVTVDRSNTENRSKSVQILKSILKKGISVLVFPEGTFNQTGKPLKGFYDGAFRIAILTQTPIKPVLFIDSYNRMHYRSFLSLTPGINRCVFLEEVSTEGMTLKDVGDLRQKVHHMMEQKLIQYNASWITA